MDEQEICGKPIITLFEELPHYCNQPYQHPGPCDTMVTEELIRKNKKKEKDRDW